MVVHRVLLIMLTLMTSHGTSIFDVRVARGSARLLFVCGVSSSQISLKDLINLGMVV